MWGDNQARWWFTADLHFDHSNIIDYCNRPWETAKEMNEALIYAWNGRIDPKDIVVFAGDLTLRHKPEQVMSFIERLNGNIIWVRGNHDWWYKKLKDKIKVRDIYTKALPLEDGTKQLIQVCHYPFRSWAYGAWHLHGHTHGKGIEPPYSMDVGVDCHNYQPVSWEEVVVIMTNDSKIEDPYHEAGRVYEN